LLPDVAAARLLLTFGVVLLLLAYLAWWVLWAALIAIFSAAIIAGVIIARAWKAAETAFRNARVGYA
jgi:cell division protein FtsW (lipid II flippase)